MMAENEIPTWVKELHKQVADYKALVEVTRFDGDTAREQVWALRQALEAVREYPWYKGFEEEEVECRFCGAYIPRSEDGDVPVYKYHHDNDCPVHSIEAALALCQEEK
jgi:hypothetical protein